MSILRVRHGEGFPQGEEVPSPEEIIRPFVSGDPYLLVYKAVWYVTTGDLCSEDQSLRKPDGAGKKGAVHYTQPISVGV
jgi:hypothetical protein